MPLVIPPAIGLALLLAAGVLAACLRARQCPPVTVNREAHERARAEWAAHRHGQGVAR